MRERARRSGWNWSGASVLVGALVLAPTGGLAETLSPEDIARLRSVTTAEISPAGGAVAYLLSQPRIPFEGEDGPAWVELWVSDGSVPARPYVHGEVNVGSPSWRPGQETITFLQKREGDDNRALYSIPLRGGEAVRLLEHATDIGSYSWSPDGSRVAFLAVREKDEAVSDLEDKGFNQEVYEEDWRPTEVWIASPEGDDEPRRIELDRSASIIEWSPDGSLLAVATAATPLVDDRYMGRRVDLVEVESGEVEGSIEIAAKLGSLGFSTDGRHLAVIAGENLNDPREGRLKVASVPDGSLRDLMPGYLGHVIDFTWSAPDELTFIGDEGVWSTLNRIQVGSERRQLLATGGPIWTGLSLADGGAEVALVGSTPTSPSELYLWRAGETKAERRTDHNSWLAERELGAQEAVRFAARDGLEIEGILVRPVGETEGQRYPLILIVHGGPEAHHSNGWLTTYSRYGQLAAGRGFAVFHTNYRGSTGRGVEFSKLSQADPAGKEFDDLVDAVDHLVETGLVDADRVGITGGSYGGYATAWGSTYYSERFAAGVMFVGISNEISKMGTTDIPNEMYLVHMRHWPWEDWSFLLERSPIYHIDKARTPLLILHGKEDPRVYPGQSMELYRFLKILGKVPVRLVFYPGEGHGNRRAASRFDYTLRSLRWMEHYLKGPGGDPPPYALDYGELAAQEGDAEAEVGADEAEAAAAAMEGSGAR